MVFRVEKIASESSLDVNLVPLRHSIRALQFASRELDREKHKAERHLVRLLRSAIRRKIIRRTFYQAVCKIKKLFGRECACAGKAHFDRDFASVQTAHGLELKPRFGRSSGLAHNQHEESANSHSRIPWGKRLRKKIKAAAERVRAVNKKLVAFEKGFIHKDGIKDREWYRHLGVAPGKWLGSCFPYSSLCLSS